MSKKDEALKLALEALELSNANHWWGSSSIEKAITAIREALSEQPAQQQEPVAWADLNALTEQFNSVNCGTAYRLPGEGRQPLYTSPPASKPLTDEQIMEMYNEPRSDAEMLEFARAIEAAHGIGEQK